MSACRNYLSTILLALSLASATWATDLEIYKAIKNGDISQVQKLIADGADINGGTNADTLLHTAIVHDKIEIVKLLLDKGADANLPHSHGYTPLHQAAQGGNHAIAALLIQSGADVNARIGGPVDNGVRPLHVAARNGRIEMTKLLLASGANPKERSGKGFGWTPLHYAARSGKPEPEIARLLLAKGADVNAKDDSERTALHFAAGNDSSMYANIIMLAKALLDAGAKVEAADNSGHTPLYNAIISGPIDAVALLLDRGANVNTGVNIRGSLTPLGLAVHAKSTITMKLLVERGANPNFTLKDGRTLLYQSLMDGSYDLAGLLLDKGADLDTTLESIVGTGKTEPVLWLLGRGVDVNARYRRGETLLHWAMDGYARNLEMTQTLLTKGANSNSRDNEGNTPLLRLFARYGGDGDLARFSERIAVLLEKGADLKVRNNKEETLLYRAVAADLPALTSLQFLLSKGADVNIPNNDLLTPLHIAVQNDRVETVQLLLAKGAKVNVKDMHLRTPLHYVKREKTIPTEEIAESEQFGGMEAQKTETHRIEVASLLLTQGADVNDKDKDGMTLLHYAALEGDLELTELLLGHGADVRIKSNNGETPLELWKRDSSSAILKLLESAAR